MFVRSHGSVRLRKIDEWNWKNIVKWLEHNGIIYYEYYFILKLIGSNSEIQLIQNIFGIIKDKDNKLKNN